jgi:SAM-dependent methyltransferase
MNLVLSSLFNLRQYRGTPRRIFVLVDAATNVAPAEYMKCVRPWSAWATLLGVVAVDRRSIIELLVSPPVREADILVMVTADGGLIQVAQAACARLGKICVDATLPPPDSRDLALFQEVLHHDFELGGWNEWSGENSQFGSPVLRLLSAVHCRQSFPKYVEPHLEALRRQTGGQPLEAIDIGCGALSRLRWGALNGIMTVTGVDPLLDMYAVVRERHGLNRLEEISCSRDVPIGAECLATRLTPASYDFVYCANALDHTENPAAVVSAIAQVLRPQGIFALEVYTREGSRENWWQLHQFDMYVDDNGQFMSETRQGVVRPMLPEGCGLVIREIVAKDATTILVTERVPD